MFTYSQCNPNSPSSSPAGDGHASGTADDQDKPQPLSKIAQEAYDEYGVLDQHSLQLSIRQGFISAEEADALPNAITADGCADTRAPVPHHRRQRLSQSATSPATISAPSPATVTPTAVTQPVPVTPAPPVASSSSRNDLSAPRPATVTPTAVKQTFPMTPAPPVASSSSHNDLSAGSSYNEKWTDDEIELLIKLRAKKLKYPKIILSFPGRNRNALRMKFRHSINNPRWKQLYDRLRAQHDGVKNTLEDAQMDIESDMEDPDAST